MSWRNLASVEPIPLQPDGVPRRVNLDPEGRTLAVEVSRQGQWQVDLIAGDSTNGLIPALNA